ncbi:MAG: hypothetical protein R2746_04995 [Acidimicrobiales bacterium]
MAELPADEQRAERRRRDGRIPEGYLLLVLGQRSLELAGRRSIARDRLAEIFAAQATLSDDLVVVTGLREGGRAGGGRGGDPGRRGATWPCSRSPTRTCACPAAIRPAPSTCSGAEVVTLEKKQPADRGLRQGDGAARPLARPGGRRGDPGVGRGRRPLRLHKDLDAQLGPALVVLHP